MEEKEGSGIGRREKLGYGAGTARSQPTPQGSPGQEWPSQVLPSQEAGKGIYISVPWDEGCPQLGEGGG